MLCLHVFKFFLHYPSIICTDMFIQKMKQRYSNTNSLTSRINVSDISEDLKQSPPYEIKSSELMQSNGVPETKYKSGGTVYYFT